VISLSRLEEYLARFPDQTIGLIGDLFLDRYLHLAAGIHETSLETSLEAFQIDQVRNVPGALGTVMNNLAALEVGCLVPITVIGNDGHGYDLLGALQSMPVDQSHIIRDPGRLTPTYTKPLRLSGGGALQELNRLDTRSREPLNQQAANEACDRLSKIFNKVDGWIVLDQVNEPEWGVVNRQVRETLARLNRANPEKLIFIDSRTQIGQFPCGVLKGNQAELTAAVETSGIALDDAIQALMAKTRQPVLCTRGAQGISVGLPDGHSIRVPGHPVAGPVDIVGAGDSVTAAVVASLIAEATFEEAAEIGCLVASITVQQLGTTGTATPEQVVFRWRECSLG
jgi:rfaE bifunctional protein kinase chain/domain